MARQSALWGWLTCLLLPLVGLLILQPIAGSALTVDAFAANQWHTLWTGHLLHYTAEHFIWDALMFVVFAGLLWKQEGARLWLWLLIAAPLISVFVFLVEPGLLEYRGLSALDTMLFARYCLGLCFGGGMVDRWLFGVLPVTGLSLKLGYEFLSGSTLFVSDLGAGVVALPSAHLAGLLLGVVWALARRSKWLGQSATNAEVVL
ncbi:MAG: hypothetical protein ACI8Z5_001637 [Lentimonas sp.]|jgi:hypothetical protein